MTTSHPALLDESSKFPFWFKRGNQAALNDSTDTTPAAEFGTQEARLWDEFQHGMAFVRNYSHRSLADFNAIAKSNMQLLHNNFRSHTYYKTLLKNAKQSYSDPGRDWTHTPLVSSHKLQGNLVTLASDATVLLPLCINSEITSLQIDAAYRLLLVVSGKIAATPNIDSKSKLNILKSNNVLIEDFSAGQRYRLLPLAKPCLLLEVTLYKTPLNLDSSVGRTTMKTKRFTTVRSSN